MRVFIAALSHETSTFSPISTDLSSFEQLEFYRPPNGKPDKYCQNLNAYSTFINECKKNKYHVYASTFACAQPSGPTKKEDYEYIRNGIIEDLKSNGQFDMVLIFHHGAQMAEGYDDCEGDLLTKIRQVVGPDVFVGGLLDLHANVTSAMIEQADALVACRNYPHTDFNERARDLFNIGKQAVKSKNKLHMGYLKIPMVGMFYTTEFLMEEANLHAKELERESGVISISLIHGFMWADMPDIGAGIIYITRDSDVDIEREMMFLAQDFANAREETMKLRKSFSEISELIESAPAMSIHKPFVIADTCDNPGGGSPGDSTFILEEILDQNLTGYVLGIFYEPELTKKLSDHEVGDVVDVTIGGKYGKFSGNTIKAKAKILSSAQDVEQFGIGFKTKLGEVFSLDIKGNTVLIGSMRDQVFSPAPFIRLGVQFDNVKAAVVKSTQHFYEQYAPIAREVLYCETNGALALNISSVAYKHLPRPMWPHDDIDFFKYFAY